MATRSGTFVRRLKTIYGRQKECYWDDRYLAGIFATPQEAPSVSRAYVLTPEKLGGRETHVLSTPERNAALLGLYHPQVVGLQEQRMLSPMFAQHPLWTWPGIDRTTLKPLSGVIDVADRLGYLKQLPLVWVPHPTAPDHKMSVVLPWCGDLLWALNTPANGICCINWTVKGNHEDFIRPLAPLQQKRPAPRLSQALLARHEIEAAYYCDAGIRTVRVAGDDIDAHVVANLRQLFNHHRRPLALRPDQRQEILEKYRTALQLGVPPSDVIELLVGRGRYSVHQCRSLLYQAIWNRELRVDLFRPVLINRPLRPEERDVADVYAAWFQP